MRSTLPLHGLSAEAVTEELMRTKSNDVDWRSGRTNLYVQFGGDDVLDVAKRAAHLYFCKKTFDLSRHSDVSEFLPLYRSVVWHYKRCGGKLPEQFLINLGTA